MYIEGGFTMARKYTPEFKADAIRYFEDHPDMDNHKKAEYLILLMDNKLNEELTQIQEKTTKMISRRLQCPKGKKIVLMNKFVEA